MKDKNAEGRKKDHIDLAFKSQQTDGIDERFVYEPIMSGHPKKDFDISQKFMGYNLSIPIWVSSMTGGTELAKNINTNLAKACQEYGMGMGLGSCRSLLENDDRLADFHVKPLMPDMPLFANLGIAQVEQIAHEDAWEKIFNLINKTEVDGLIIHINPLQEFFQPEGDRYHDAPIDTISKYIDAFPDTPLIVKEVGHGMGYESLRALYELPLAAVEFAAMGGTNFSKLELLRSDDARTQALSVLANVGHTAEDMVFMVNEILETQQVQCNHTIISGGIKNFLDGYQLINICNSNAIYGQASAFLKPAMESYQSLQRHIEIQREGLQIAHSLLSL